MIRIVRVALLCCLVAASGCAWTAQHVNLKPTLDISPGSVGKGRTIYVSVDDERPSQILGHKVPAGGGEIKPVQEPATVVQEAFVSGLGQLGFANATKPSEGVPQLDVELRAIDYKVTQGFWSGGLYVDVALKALCKIGPTVHYDSLYRGHHEENIQVAQSQTNNESYINDALSQAINTALRDPRLIDCLAAAPGT
jgi:hypothetical protein